MRTLEAARLANRLAQRMPRAIRRTQLALVGRARRQRRTLALPILVTGIPFRMERQFLMSGSSVLPSTLGGRGTRRLALGIATIPALRTANGGLWKL